LGPQTLQGWLFRKKRPKLGPILGPKRAPIWGPCGALNQFYWPHYGFALRDHRPPKVAL